MLLDHRTGWTWPAAAPRCSAGRSGQWYRLARSGTGWDLDAAADPDPAALLTTPDVSTVTR